MLQVLKAPHGDLLSCIEMVKVTTFTFALLQGLLFKVVKRVLITVVLDTIYVVGC